MFSSIIALLLLTSTVLGTPAFLNANETFIPCGTDHSTDKVRKNEAHFASNVVQRPTNASNSTTDAVASATVPVYFHVITADDSVTGGNVSDFVLSQQVSVLNNNYQGTGLSFTIAGVTRTRKPQWFNIRQGSIAQYEMKLAFRPSVPSSAVLHVYTVGSISSDFGQLLGYATFPADYNDNPVDDGVVLDFHTLPGLGPNDGYNLGKILTHEVGHWVGLYHTFMGGCFGSGDYVDDTPAEASPASATGVGCPVGRDSCPSPGLDPIHNYMDYSDNNCMNQFTTGQAKRLAAQIRTYRGIPL